MTSALATSRQLLSRSLRSLRGAGDSADGPPIHVTPFDSHNVSTGAALLKLATSISAARRAKRAQASAQQDAELQREYVRAQIAHLRAQGAHEQSEADAPAKQPRQPWASGPGMTYRGQPIKEGLDRPSFNARIHEIDYAEKPPRNASTAGPRAALDSLHQRIKDEAGAAAGQSYGKLSSYLTMLSDPDNGRLVPTVNRRTGQRGSETLLTHALGVLQQEGGVDLSSYAVHGKQAGLYPTDILARQKVAADELKGALLQKHKARLLKQYEPDLSAARDALLGGAQDAGGEPPPFMDTGDTDERDTGGLFSNP